jgi:hypothetical protein
LTPNGTIAFEMLAVRSRANGFEIEFTKPAGQGADNPDNYTVRRWGFEPVEQYGGGNALNNRAVTVTSLALSDDRTKVMLELNADDLLHDQNLAMKSTVFWFNLSNITSEGGENLWSPQAWYTLNTIGPADILGCMDQGYEEYNPEAEYDDGLQCKNMTSDIKRDLFLSPRAANEIYVQRKQKGSILLNVPFISPYTFEITDIKGTVIKSGKSNAPEKIELSHLEHGIYMVMFKSGIQSYFMKIIVY